MRLLVAALATVLAGCQTTGTAMTDPQLLAVRCAELDVAVLSLELFAPKKHQATVTVARATLDTVCATGTIPTDYPSALATVSAALVKIKQARGA